VKGGDWGLGMCLWGSIAVLRFFPLSENLHNALQANNSQTTTKKNREKKNTTDTQSRSRAIKPSSPSQVLPLVVVKFSIRVSVRCKFFSTSYAKSPQITQHFQSLFVWLSSVCLGQAYLTSYLN